MAEKIGRREFLRKALVTVGAAVAVPFLVPQLAKAYDEDKGWSLPIQYPSLQFVSELVPRQETKMIILHHVGGTDRDVSAAEVHQWHIQNGWAGIGYHYLVHKDGTIEAGRPVYTIGAHCYGFNEGSVGICSVGNYEEAYPPQPQLDAVAKLTAMLCQRYGITPGPTTILGHRDLNETECPGAHYYALLPQVRQQIAAQL